VTSAPALDLEAVAGQIAEQGWVVVPDIIPPETVGALRGGVERTMARADTPFGGNAFLGEHTRRVFNLLSHDPLFGSVPLQAELLGIAEKVLGRELLLSSLTAIESHPGQDQQPLHADDGSIPLARPHPPLALVALWALTDFTDDNGATRLVPQSHNETRRPDPGEDVETVTATMGAGSVLLYNGSIWHGGGANRSEDRRMFIVCNYCPGWIRQEESQLLGLDREYVATLPDRLRRLLGYGVYRGLLGHVAGTDPGSWFDESIESDLIWNRMR
jgi:hypothetical protein